MILCFDPSGNFSEKEGSGVTGWALFQDNDLVEFGDIKACDFDNIEEYWSAHTNLMWDKVRSVTFTHNIVCESYRLQPGKAKQQSWSSLETPQLIGAMRMYNHLEEMLQHNFVLQDPAIKARFSDEVLVELGIAEKIGKYYYILGRMTNLHERDAIRHGLYYLRYGVKKNVERKDNSDSIK